MIDGTRCKMAGWGSILANKTNPKFEHDLRELKDEPVLKSKKCTLRTLGDVVPKGTLFSTSGLTPLFENYELFHFRRKFQFCVDLTKGPPRSAVPVRQELLCIFNTDNGHMLDLFLFASI